METINDILQLVAVVFVAFVLYLLFKYFVYLFRKNRLQDFSLKVKGTKNGIIIRTIKKVSKVLRKIKFIKIHRYNVYARHVSNFDDGYDVLSSKLLCSLFFALMYSVVTLLYKDNINWIIFIVSLIIGFYILDFYYISNSKSNYKLVNKDLLGAVLIMNNDFKANRSIEQAINDVIERKSGPIKLEFKKALDDAKLGFNYGEAFLRMYKRTNIKGILYISYAFSLYTLIGSDLIEVFDNIEKKLIEEEKLEIQVKSIKRFNNCFRGLFFVLPVLVVWMLYNFNNYYRELLIGSVGPVIISILLLLYVIYIITINKIVRRYDYDNK